MPNISISWSLGDLINICVFYNISFADTGRSFVAGVRRVAAVSRWCVEQQQWLCYGDMRPLLDGDLPRPFTLGICRWPAGQRQCANGTTQPVTWESCTHLTTRRGQGAESPDGQRTRMISDLVMDRGGLSFSSDVTACIVIYEDNHCGAGPAWPELVWARVI